MDLNLTEAEQHKQDNTKAFNQKQRGKNKDRQKEDRRAVPYERERTVTHNGKDLKRVTRLSDLGEDE